MANFDAIVAGSHLRYDGVRQRPQHVLTRLAERVPLLIVEAQHEGAIEHEEFGLHGNLTTLRPVRQNPNGGTVDERTLAAVRRWAHGRKPLLWLYTPELSALAGAVPGARIVYDCMDELSAFLFAPADLHRRELELLERASLVFCGGRSLYEARAHFGVKVHLFPSGVEFEHFASARESAPAQLVSELPRPVFAYAGVIDERLDYTIVDELARCEASTLMIGPFAKIDPAVLPGGPNVHYTGHVPYSALPGYLAGVDVAIMPFALSEATRYISPTKTPEYLASGRPVVSTRIKDVVTGYGDVVTFASGPSAFAGACLAAARTPDPRRLQLGSERAREAGWNAIVDRMWTLLSSL